MSNTVKYLYIFLLIQNILHSLSLTFPGCHKMYYILVMQIDPLTLFQYVSKYLILFVRSLSVVNYFVFL